MTVLAQATHIVCEEGYANFTVDEEVALDESKVHIVKSDFLSACCFFGLKKKLPNVNDFSFKMESTSIHPFQF